MGAGWPAVANPLDQPWYCTDTDQSTCFSHTSLGYAVSYKASMLCDELCPDWSYPAQGGPCAACTPDGVRLPAGGGGEVVTHGWRWSNKKCSEKVCDPECPSEDDCCGIGLFICNKNAASDDNYDVLINGIKVGEYNGSGDSLNRAEYIATDNDLGLPTCDLSKYHLCGGTYDCEPCDEPQPWWRPVAGGEAIQSYTFPWSVLQVGSNDVDIVWASDNVDSETTPEDGVLFEMRLCGQFCGVPLGPTVDCNVTPAGYPGRVCDDVCTPGFECCDCINGVVIGSLTRNVNLEGRWDEHRAKYIVGSRGGTIKLNLSAYSHPDTFRVYYDGNRIYDEIHGSKSGYCGAAGTLFSCPNCKPNGEYEITWPSGQSNEIEIVVNETGSNPYDQCRDSTAWQYAFEIRKSEGDGGLSFNLSEKDLCCCGVMSKVIAECEEPFCPVDGGVDTGAWQTPVPNPFPTNVLTHSGTTAGANAGASVAAGSGDAPCNCLWEDWDTLGSGWPLGGYRCTNSGDQFTEGMMQSDDGYCNAPPCTVGSYLCGRDVLYENTAHRDACIPHFKSWAYTECQKWCCGQAQEAMVSPPTDPCEGIWPLEECQNYVINTAVVVLNNGFHSGGGTGWINQTAVTKGMADLNAKFAFTGISFNLKGTIWLQLSDYEDPDHLYDQFDNPSSAIIAAAHAQVSPLDTYIVYILPQENQNGPIPGGGGSWSHFPSAYGVAASDGSMMGAINWLDAPGADWTLLNKGVIFAHETGHYLGLYHTWGDGDCSDDDGISDTPNHNGPTYGCPCNSHHPMFANTSNCRLDSRTPRAPNPSDFGSCSGSVPPIHNYMNYIDDGCAIAQEGLGFTTGQIAYMKAVLETTGRKNVLMSTSSPPSSSTEPETAGAN